MCKGVTQTPVECGIADAYYRRRLGPTPRKRIDGVTITELSPSELSEYHEAFFNEPDSWADEEDFINE